MARERVFREVIKSREVAEAKPAEEFLAELDDFIEAHNPYRVNKVIWAIGEGTAPPHVVKRYAMELYYLGKWISPEFGFLIANAPDTNALTLDHSEHYLHWSQNLADEFGYLGDPNHVGMKVEYCRQLGISDQELNSYVPIPETIGSVFTLLFYMRRSYEEGLAAFGYARERVAGMSGYAQAMYEGLHKHYGLTVQDLEVHAYAEPQHGDMARELLRKVATTASLQARCRQAVMHTILTNEWRARAISKLLEE